MARLYSNENFPRSTVEYLRRLGHDVLTIQDTGRGKEGVSDPEVVRFATQDHRAVLTLNRRHFIKLHNLSNDRSGIIVCTVDSDFERQAARIDKALSEHPQLDRQLIRVNRDS